MMHLQTYLCHANILLLGILGSIHLLDARGASRKAHRKNKESPTKSNLDWCPPCDISHCPVVLESTCNGVIKLDWCECCPICTGQVVDPSPDREENPDTHVQEQTSSLLTYQTTNQSEACAKITCPKFQVCMLNIQGLPMCRCPTKFWCMKGERSPVCGQNNITYKSKCFLKMDECEKGKNIPLQRKGKCFKSEQDRELKLERLRLKEEKKQEREERRKRKQEKKEKEKKKKNKLKKKEKRREKREKKQKRWAKKHRKYSFRV